ncbi:MAG: proteasome-type protease [Rhodospirillales bacterium]|nr:proteasome-type protease [Rhodospirillales bacterium]MBO6786619.1 proteasome-type protease [Rhodospirillales bacterium]
MTYCLGIRLNDGIVFAADSRTNAGVDNISKFRKLFVFEKPGERAICVLTAGNLAITQAVISQLEEGLDDGTEEDTLYSVASLSEAAKMVGRALRNVHERDDEYLRAQEADTSATFIVGGQIAGRRMRLFLVYSAGNYIEATDDTPYMQIGESKYGKPILERVVTPEMDLAQAAKCALVSIDSTIRSNVAVAPPIDMVIIRSDENRIGMMHRIKADEPYYTDLSKNWGEGLKSLFDSLPTPSWLSENSS